MKVVAQTILALAALASTAYAQSCPNGCSGHGTCNAENVCECDAGFGMNGQDGGDCSERLCAYGLSWADEPDSSGMNHRYAECSSKGICNRESGECECYDGFEGKACVRQFCPNDCNGHGTCEYMKDLTYGTVFNKYSSTGLGVGAKTFSTGTFWDSDRARACVCDAGYTGSDCSERLCPMGNDVLDTSGDALDAAGKNVQTVTVYAQDDAWASFNSKTFALKFTTQLNETFSTNPIAFPADVTGGSVATDMDTLIKNALTALPRHVIHGDVAVATTIDTNTPKNIAFAITFHSTGQNQGTMHSIEVLADACANNGCNPHITGLLLNAYDDGANVKLSKVVQTTAGDYNSYQCGRRGKCDFDTGICECFEGFTGDHCDSLTSLV
jgi:hypothetical protein